MSALDLQTLRLPISDEVESDESSYEEESISSSDDESFFSYYSIDHLSTIQEETDQDIMNEMSKRGSRSRRGTGRSVRTIDSSDDLPPSPPVRSRSRDGDFRLPPRGPTTSTYSTKTESSPSIHSSGSVSIQSTSPLSNNSKEPLLPPVNKGGDLRAAPLSEPEVEQLDEDSSFWSEPLNDVEKGSFSGRKSGLVSAKTGEELFLTPSDDEFTFVTCASTDDMSFLSDLGSSRHDRTGFSLEGSSRHKRTADEGGSSHHERTIFSLEEMERLSDHQRSAASLNVDTYTDGLLPIPEDESSDGDHSTGIATDPLDYEQVQRKLGFEISRNLTKKRLKKRKSRRELPVVLDPLQRRQNFQIVRDRIMALGPLLEDHTMESTPDASAQRLVALKHRLRLERYSGVRRRKSFERSRRLLGKSFGKVTKSMEPEDSSDPFGAPQPLPDRLARFGGLTRRESFRNVKSEFEKKFDKEVKPLVNPLRRRRSLSPVRCELDLDKRDFIVRMTKSDGHLVFNIKDTDETDDDIAKSADDLVLDPKFEQRFKQRQEQFGGLRRRTSFKRSQRVLSKRFDKIQARSKEERERFGGLQRMNSYKQSRNLFQRPRRKTRPLFIAPEDEPAYEDNPANEFAPPSKSSDWSYRLEEAFKEYHRSSVGAESYEQIIAPSFDNLFKTLETPPTKLAISPEMRRARKNLQHAFKNQQQTMRA